MNSTKALLALVAGSIVSIVLTTVYYVITDEPNFVPIRRPEMIYGGLLLTHFIFVGIMVFMYPRWMEGARATASQGARYGALMAAMMFIPQAILVRSIWTVEFNAIFVANSIAHVTIGAIIGIVITRILGVRA